MVVAIEPPGIALGAVMGCDIEKLVVLIQYVGVGVFVELKPRVQADVASLCSGAELCVEVQDRPDGIDDLRSP